MFEEAKPAVRPGTRGTADPVKGLLHRHRTLCERAVDPLEIAAGLEAHGITDRTAARFRHRDVFSLAEELYARVPHGGEAAAGAAGEAFAPESASPAQSARPAHRTGTRRLADWMVLTLLPGAVASLTLAGLEHTAGQGHLAVGLAGSLALTGTLAACLRRGPLRAEGRTVPAAGLWVHWLLAYLVCGDGLLDALVTGGPDGPWPATTTPLTALACAVAPAAWCAHLFSVRSRRRLAESHGLADFTAGARPLLLALVALYAGALTALATAANLVFDEDGAPAAIVALGTLFLLARLLTVHGFPHAAATGLAAASAVEVLACASVLAGRFPGCDQLAVPVTHAVQAWGPASVPALACGAAALGLLVHAAVALSRASAHT
ncbi:hypothetical protein KQY30_11735 [Streptomyces sp. GMY02]|uniref:hypothetical protein n=1 Tax=Streptomyces sp. GMY02 TaxID=1333528 RepID=UPI001C2C59A1|nr:hypothetical protein [Streptomyces sp. GMY02]QXE34844.1 hypothetical protein KQY30_11735 [Streptomyces sp. GMY02]